MQDFVHQPYLGNLSPRATPEPVGRPVIQIVAFQREGLKIPGLGV